MVSTLFLESSSSPAYQVLESKATIIEEEMLVCRKGYKQGPS